MTVANRATPGSAVTLTINSIVGLVGDVGRLHRSCTYAFHRLIRFDRFVDSLICSIQL